jgi:hypothetical protein
LYILDQGSVEDEDREIGVEDEDVCTEVEERREDAVDIFRNEKSIRPELPEQIAKCTNRLEIYSWLVENPEILELANKMLNAKQSNVIGSVSENSSIIPIGGSTGILRRPSDVFLNNNNSFGDCGSSSVSNVTEEVRNSSPYFIILLFIFVII